MDGMVLACLKEKPDATAKRGHRAGITFSSICRAPAIWNKSALERSVSPGWRGCLGAAVQRCLSAGSLD